MYSANRIARSASRMRCWITCFAVIAAMRPKSVGVTSARAIWCPERIPVELELVVVNERVLALARLLLEPLELVELALARVVEQALLDVGGQLDREDAEVAFLVDLDHRVTEAPGVFLYAARSASSSAATSVPARCPSRARSRECLR